MRPSLALLVLFLAPVVFAQTDARMAFLTKQLSSASDPRVRAQTAVILGASKDAAAVSPLCRALKDSEAVVRAAAANALGELRAASATACLRERLGEPNADVREAISKALAVLQARHAVYLALNPVADKTHRLSRAELALLEEKLRAKLVQMGVVFAPENESTGAAAKVLREKKLKGFLLRPEVLPHGIDGLQLKILCMTYPDKALRGQAAPKGRGPVQKLLPALVTRAVEDTAEECGWSE
ncbi:MAG: HEAT repeat domain-containing protein [Myxococcota bacterium]